MGQSSCWTNQASGSLQKGWGVRSGEAGSAFPGHRSKQKEAHTLGGFLALLQVSQSCLPFGSFCKEEALWDSVPSTSPSLSYLPNSTEGFPLIFPILNRTSLCRSPGEGFPSVSQHSAAAISKELGRSREHSTFQSHYLPCLFPLRFLPGIWPGARGAEGWLLCRVLSRSLKYTS